MDSPRLLGAGSLGRARYVLAVAPSARYQSQCGTYVLFARTMTTRLTGGEAIVASLLAHRVDTLFGIPGVQTYGFFDALFNARDRIRVLHPRHEQTTAYMAFGYAKVTGRPGVFSVVPGPGMLNASAAVASRVRRECPGPVHHRPGSVRVHWIRTGSSARVARSARDHAYLHEVGRAHRASGAGAGHVARSLPSDDHGPAEAGGRGDAVGGFHPIRARGFVHFARCHAVHRGGSRF